MKYGTIASATVFSLVTCLLACATSTSTFIPDDGGTTGDASSDASTKSDARDGSSTEDDSSTGVDSATGECLDSTSQFECVSCCTSAHPSGAQTYFAVLLKCMCVPANCQTECASTSCSASPQLGDAACNACLNSKASACVAEIKAGCTPNANCVAFADCSTKASCLSKP